MYNIGIDIGGTNIKAAIVNDDGVVIDKKITPTIKDRLPTEIIKSIVGLVRELLSENGLETRDISAMGIGSPGIVDAEQGIIIYTSNLPFRNLNFKNELNREFSVPVFIQNDAYCATLGELIAGEAKHYNNTLNVMIGTGIGGGIIIDGRIYSGCNSGEFGHHTINFDGLDCSCGRKGCWEQYASATALIKLMQRHENPGMLGELCNNDLSRINAKMIFDAANKFDKSAMEVLDDYIKYLAVGLMNLLAIFNPELLIIGGGISLQGEKLLERLKNSLKCSGMLSHDTKINCSLLGNDAGIIGAAMLKRYKER